MQILSLDQVLTFHRGITFKPDDKVSVGSPNSIVCLRTKNIQSELDESDLLAVPRSFVKRDELLVRRGDILISSANSWDLVGKCVRITETKYESTLGGFISLLRPNLDKVDPDYLYRFISMSETQSTIRQMGKQTTNISNLDRVRFLEIEIPLPPISTQKQIAAILEKADQLRKDCQQMEQELNNLAQSVFIDMFGDPVSNPKGWPKVVLAEMVESRDDIKCGPFGTQLAKSEFKLTGVPLWGIKNVNNGFRVAPHEFVSLEKAKNLHTYSIEAGDIVMTRKGNVGNCHIYPAHLENGIMHSDLLRIRPSKNKVDSNFLQKQFMYSRDVEDQLRLISQGAIMAGINVTKLKSLTLIYPPINLQTKFSNIISKIDAQHFTLAKVKQEHEENFVSLMQKAFNGELKTINKAA